MSTDTAEFTLTRQFTLSRDELWHLLTDAKMRENWGAPEEGQTLTLLTEDFRRRGIERHRCGDSGPDAFEVETRWYHINAPTDAVFTESIEAGGQDIATSLVTYRVTDADEGTKRRTMGVIRQWHFTAHAAQTAKNQHARSET